MAGKIVTKTELSAILGKTPKTLTIWQAEGMPHTPGERPTDPITYNTHSVIDWLIAREAHGGLDLETERALLARQQTETARLRNEEKKGELVPLAAVVEIAQRAAFAIRQKIVSSKLTDDEKRALLIDINNLAGADYSSFARNDEAEEDLVDGQRQDTANS
jgi:phage terminase Nu1 subunit (DNA packaging protein)